jgi:hypothetical protein
MKHYLTALAFGVTALAQAQTSAPAADPAAGPESVPAMQGHPPMQGHPAMQGHPPMQGHPAMQGHPPMAGHPAPAAAGGVKEYRLPAELFQTPRMGAVRPAQAAAPTNEGTVAQMQTAGGYTYIEVTGPQGNTWLAAPAMNIAVGTRIRYESGAVMTNFTSAAMKRTFPTILFVGGVEPINSTEGKVAQTQTAGGYTYIEVKHAKGSEWLAAPAMAVKAGDTVRYEGGSVMSNFTSGALKRTFPSILFVGGVEVVRAP